MNNLFFFTIQYLEALTREGKLCGKKQEALAEFVLILGDERYRHVKEEKEAALPKDYSFFDETNEILRRILEEDA